MAIGTLDPVDLVDLYQALELAQAEVDASTALDEAAARAERGIPDPVAFSIEAGIMPDPWQADLLRSTDPRVIVNCSRQIGKSTTTATLAVHTALYQPNTLVLLVSRALRQSSELFRKCASVYRAVGRPVRSTHETSLSVELENDSRIVALPGNEATVRSFSGAGVIVIDEASRVPDDLYFALRPMLSSAQGRLFLLSSPFGKRGFFYREFTQGGAIWRRFRVTAEESGRHTPEFLAEERASMPRWFYDQEYMCNFGDNVAQIFPTDLVLSAGSADLEPLFALIAEQASASDPGLAPLFGSAS